MSSGVAEQTHMSTRESKYGPLLSLLLEKRGLTDEQEIEDFLQPSYENGMHDPFLLAGMEEAVDRIYKAVQEKEAICVYGDYDCDGIPASVILHDFLQKIGHENFIVFIPDRQNEGYGLHVHAIERFIEQEVSLIITVDLGINAVEQVAFANEQGIDVIVTDHHEPQDVLPQAHTIINPKQTHCQYPDDMLCGAGVAFKLVQAFLQKHREEFEVPEGWEKWLLDMVGLATLSDMVPLRGENRVFAYYGMKVLQKTRREGLLALYKEAGLRASYLTEDDIAFMVVPKINAAGRLDHPMRGFEALVGGEPELAIESAKKLIAINKKRKTLVAHTVKDVKKRLSKRDLQSVVVVGDPDFHIGITGLVASKVVETFGKPAFVWGQDDRGMLKGSFRSDGTISYLDLVASFSKDIFSEFGGHKEAGGFTVEKENIHFLEEIANNAYAAVVDGAGAEEVLKQEVSFDMEMGVSEVHDRTYRTLRKLAPFGIGNEKPLFVFRRVELANVREFGKEKNHLEILVADENGAMIKGIRFFATRNTFAGGLEEGDVVDVYATIEKSFFMGKVEVRLRIEDIHKVVDK